MNNDTNVSVSGALISPPHSDRISPPWTDTLEYLVPGFGHFGASQGHGDGETLPMGTQAPCGRSGADVMKDGNCVSGLV